MTSAKTKIAISLRTDVLERVRGEVGQGEAKSVSAYIEHAIVGQLAAEVEFDQMLEEIFEATGGPLTEAERAAARRVIDGETP